MFCGTDEESVIMSEYMDPVQTAHYISQHNKLYYKANITKIRALPTGHKWEECSSTIISNKCTECSQYVYLSNSTTISGTLSWNYLPASYWTNHARFDYNRLEECSVARMRKALE